MHLNLLQHEHQVPLHSSNIYFLLQKINHTNSTLYNNIVVSLLWFAYQSGNLAQPLLILEMYMQKEL